MAHLFNSVHEQTYVAFVIAYSARIGPYKDTDLTNYSEEFLSPMNQVLAVIAALLTVFASTVLLV